MAPCCSVNIWQTVLHNQVNWMHSSWITITLTSPAQPMHPGILMNILCLFCQIGFTQLFGGPLFPCHVAKVLVLMEKNRLDIIIFTNHYVNVIYNSA